jgi:acetone carboxylase gamma subunit
MTGSYDKETVRRLIDDQLPWADIKRMMSRYKDSDRFQTYRALLQERMEWPERILLPLSEHLFIVQHDDASRWVRCECGHTVCRARENWRLHVLISVRDTPESLEEIYPGVRAPDPQYMELREYYCPSCATQLEVDAVTPAYPIVHEFEPDVDAFYRDWLGQPLEPDPAAGSA